MSIEAPVSSLIASAPAVSIAASVPSVEFSPSFSNFSSIEINTPSIDLGGSFNADFNPSSFKNYEVFSTPLFDHPMDASEDIAAYTSIFSAESPALPAELAVIPDAFLDPDLIGGDINIPEDFSARFEPARFEAAQPALKFVMPARFDEASARRASEFDLNFVVDKIVEDFEVSQLEIDGESEFQTFTAEDNQEIAQAIARVSAEPLIDVQPTRAFRNSLATRTTSRSRVELMPETEVVLERQEEKVTVLEDQEKDTETVDQREEHKILRKAKLIDQDASKHRLEMVRQTLANIEEDQTIKGEELGFSQETDPMRSGVLKQGEDDGITKQPDGSYSANIESFRSIRATTKEEFIDKARAKIRETPPVILGEGQDQVGEREWRIVTNRGKAPITKQETIIRIIEKRRQKMVERKVEEEVLEAA